MNSLYDEVLAILHGVWRRRWLALAVAWVVCLLGWLVVAMIPNTYESSARIFVQLDNTIIDVVEGSGVDRRRDVEMVRQTLTSATNLQKVIRSTGMGDGLSPREIEGAVLGLSKNIKVRSTPEGVFEITAISSDKSLSDTDNAKLAQSIVQKLIDIFHEQNLEGGRGDVNQTLTFLNQQLQTKERQLEEVEQRRQLFEANNPEMAQGGLGGAQRLEAARAALRGLDADIAAAQSALAAINGQLAGTPPTIATVGAGGGVKGALTQATNELAALRARGLTDNHPDVITLRNQIANLRAAAQNESGPMGSPNPAYTSLQSIKAERQANAQGLIARRTSLEADLANLTARQISNPQLAAEAKGIDRDYGVLREQYDKLLRDRESITLRGAVKTESEALKFQVTDPPTVPRRPIAPNRPVLLIGVLIAGIGAGVGAAFALGQLRATFATQSKLERATGLPVLGAISLNLTDAARALNHRRLKYFIGGAGALAGLCVLLLAAEFVQRSMLA